MCGATHTGIKFLDSVANIYRNIRHLADADFRSYTQKDAWLMDWVSSASSSGEHVTEASAQKLATVYTCLRILSETLGAMPIHVMKREGEAKKRVNHIVSDLFKDLPMRQAWIKSAAASGDGYLLIHRDTRQRPNRLEFVPLSDMIQTVSKRKIFYRVDGLMVDSADILHLIIYTNDGLSGVSPIRQNAETMGFGQKLHKYSAKIFDKRPPGYLKTDQALTAGQLTDIRRGFNVSDDGLPVAFNGLEYEKITLSPGDAEFIMSKDVTTEDIFGIFGIPPSLGQKYRNGQSSYSSQEQQDIQIGKYTLTPWVTNIEQQINQKLFIGGEEDYYVKHNMNSLLRSDFKTRSEAWRILYHAGLVSDTFIYEMEDWDTSKTNGRRILPMNVVYEDLADRFQESVIKKGESVGQKAERTDDVSEEEIRMALKNLNISIEDLMSEPPNLNGNGK